MAIDPKDRAAYEEGLADGNRGIIETIVQETAEIVVAIVAPVPRGRTESEQAAYEKGRIGEQLDEDKADA